MASSRRFDKGVILITDLLSFSKPFECWRRKLKGDLKLSLHFIHGERLHILHTNLSICGLSLKVSIGFQPHHTGIMLA